MLLGSTPSEPLVRAEGALALTLGSGLMGALGGRLIEPAAPEVAWLLAPLLALVGLAAGARPHVASEDVNVTWTAVGGSFIVIPVSFYASPEPWLCLALFAATPVGLLLNATWVTLLGGLRDLAAGRSAEDVDLARLYAGRWLLRLGMLGGVSALALGDGYLAVVSSLTCAAGAHRWWLGTTARHQRGRWLARVAGGRVDGWRLLPIAELPAELTEELPPLMRARPSEWVLVETAGEECGPYREGLGGIPRALVPAVDHVACSVPWRAPSAEARAAAAVLGAVFAPFLGLTVGAMVAVALTPHLGLATHPTGLVGWILLISGPTTGAMVAGLTTIAHSTRAAVLGVGVGIYSLLAPGFCWLVSLTYA